MKLRVLGLIALVISLASHVTWVAAAPDEYRWVLVDVIDNPNQTGWESANESDAYTYEPEYSRGSYSVKTTYKGPTDTYYTPPYLHGEALAVSATWSQPPQIIKAGEAVVLHVRVGTLSNSLSAFKFSGSARAFLGGANMVTGEGTYHFECKSSTNWSTINETVSATAGSGSGEGDRLELEVTFYSSNPMSTTYIYEWTATKPPVDPMTHNWQPPAREAPRKTVVDKKSDLDIYPPGPVYDEKGQLMDSGIKVSDLYGEVEYLLPDRDDEDGQWELLEMGTVLPINTRIRTSGESGVILSLPDTTYEMKSDSTVILTRSTGKRNLLKLVAGNIMTNLKKMVDHGMIEVEMSQAIAGARGTTFVCTEDENGSTLKVLEGTVEFAPHGKAPLSLSAGETISMQQGVVGGISTFSPAKELATWSDKTQERIQGILAAQGITLEGGAEAAPEVKAELEAPAEPGAKGVSKAADIAEPSGQWFLIGGGLMAAGILAGLLVLLFGKRR